jgi:serine/threonine protein kinase
MPLPPLRTARDVATSKQEAAAASQSTGLRLTPAESLPSGLAGPPNAPAPLRRLLGTLLTTGLVDASEIPPFIEALGPKIHQLVDPDRAAVALHHHGVITAYQAERLVHNNLFGLVFGNYRIQDRINAGSVGTVFKAVHKSLKRVVAIKAIPSDESTPQPFLDRFDQEMELLARLDHPHIVRVYDTGTLVPTEPGLSPLKYAVLEYLDGGDLENYVYHNGTVPVGLACEWCRQIASGLAAAHDQNLIHRDLKPSNVLLTRDRRAKMTDLGLARHFASISTPRPGIVGSVEFMPPEQVNDAGTVGPAADVYALGATLFWILTGQLIYPQSKSTKESIHIIRTTEPKRLRDVSEHLSEDLETLIDRMLARVPSERPTARAVALELAGFANASAHGVFDAAPVPPVVDSQLDLLRFANHHLEDALASRSVLGAEAATAVLTTLARVAQFRGESAGSSKRLQEYVRAMIRVIRSKPEWNHFADDSLVSDVIKSIPARNVGFVGIADRILNAAGELPHDEQTALERHPLIGCHILDFVVARHGQSLPFARIARDVIRSHHERWDGSGFPEKLRGEAIPHAARLVAIAEAYDALRQPLGNDPGFPHEAAIEGLINDSKGFFDPEVVNALVAAHETIAHIYDSIPD